MMHWVMKLCKQFLNLFQYGELFSWNAWEHNHWVNNINIICKWFVLVLPCKGKELEYTEKSSFY